MGPHAVQAFANTPVVACICCPPSKHPPDKDGCGVRSPMFNQVQPSALPVTTFARLFESMKAGLLDERG